MLGVKDTLRLSYTERKQRKSDVAPDGFLVNLNLTCYLHQVVIKTKENVRFRIRLLWV